jgi:hypothetical protein
MAFRLLLPYGVEILPALRTWSLFGSTLKISKTLLELFCFCTHTEKREQDRNNPVIAACRRVWNK